MEPEQNLWKPQLVVRASAYPKQPAEKSGAGLLFAGKPWQNWLLAIRPLEQSIPDLQREFAKSRIVSNGKVVAGWLFSTRWIAWEKAQVLLIC